MASKEGGGTPEVQEFCLITGATLERAQYMLEACNYDLQVALNLQLEGGDANIDIPPPVVADEEVRAPILPREDVLVDSIEAHNMNQGNMKRNGGSTSVFDSFRDFQVEATRQEEMLQDPRPARSNRKRRLEDLFRPPLDIIFHGSFQMARDAGIAKNKWLMVNPQNSTEFPCQVLNRDIWSDSAIKSIVEEHFIFWQVYIDSSEGQQYNQYYHVDRYPYVSVVDPRTGELLKKWHVIEKPFFAEQLLHFLQEHQLPSRVGADPVQQHSRLAALPTQHKQATVTSATQNAYSESAIIPLDDVFPKECNPSSSKNSCNNKRSKIEKIKCVKDGREPAENSATDSDEGSELNFESTDGSSLDSSSDNSSKLAVNSVSIPETTRTCTDGEPTLMTTLSLRFPDSNREIVKFASNSKIKALQTLLHARGYPASKYHYMTYFPKRKLNSDDVSDATFITLGIVHNETIFIHSVDQENTL